ncbi:MAG: hypothetical protein HQM16_01755 [Deltaproteobacteria bacterium]|nr:hypothetical protein [Deltaproteobacteria bacterium]
MFQSMGRLIGMSTGGVGVVGAGVESGQCARGQAAVLDTRAQGQRAASASTPPQLELRDAGDRFGFAPAAPVVEPVSPGVQMSITARPPKELPYQLKRRMMAMGEGAASFGALVTHKRTELLYPDEFKTLGLLDDRVRITGEIPLITLLDATGTEVVAQRDVILARLNRIRGVANSHLGGPLRFRDALTLKVAIIVVQPDVNQSAKNADTAFAALIGNNVITLEQEYGVVAGSWPTTIREKFGLPRAENDRQFMRPVNTGDGKGGLSAVRRSDPTTRPVTLPWAQGRAKPSWMA